MKTLPSVIIAYLLFFNCSSDFDIQTEGMPPPLADVLTLELSFGDEKTIDKDEFLFAQPMGITVNDSGDIFVVDENSVKVYDNNGKEKMIIGRPGQGPGEFLNAGNPIITQSGYLTVTDIGIFGFSVFGPDYKFIYQLNSRTNPRYRRLAQDNEWSSIGVNRAYTLSENYSIVFVAGFEPKREAVEYRSSLLVYDKGDTLIEIARYRVKSHVGGMTTLNQGSLLGGMLTGNRVVYSHSLYDRVITGNNAQYILNIVSLDDFKTTKIHHRFTPEIISDEAISLWQSRVRTGKNSPEAKLLKDIIKEAKYQEPIMYLFTDRQFIFVFSPRRNETKDYLVDIFDADEGMYINSAIFPFQPRVIKNGYVYKVRAGGGEFPVVEKYKIDPAVYVK